jgi:group I intron endonuclease
MVSHYIYKITNTLNKKIYVGKTKNPKVRWRQHKCHSKKRNTKLYYAMRKYGIENFTFKILEECLESQVNERETYYVSLLEPYYNMTNGGDGGGFLNKKHGDNWKSAIKRSNSKKVACYDLEGNLIKVYESCREASYDIFNKDTRGIDAVTRGEYQTYGGYQWKSFDINPILKIEPYKRTSHNIRKIGKYDLSNNLIEVYDSMTIAAKKNNASTSKITLVCQGKRKTHSGHIWKYIV